MSASRKSTTKSGKARSGKRVAELDEAKKSEVDQAQRDLIFADPKKIDFSGQAAVILPSSIFQRTEVEELYLENNNFRAIPPDISKLKRLRILNISKNNLSAMLPEDRTSNVMPPLPTQLDQLNELVDLNIAECNLSFIPDVVFKILSLRSLNISRNKIGALPADVANLVNLEVLNAQYCGLKTLPSDIICCENLTELILYGNALENLPEEFYALTRLTTLKLNTQYFARKLDTHMDTLLVRNQLQSTHVPPVIFELPAIRELSLECSKLNVLPNDIAVSLESISLKLNYFRQFPRSMFNLTNLRMIDFSSNRLAELPDEIEKLEALQYLCLANNDLGLLPETLVNLLQLETLELQNNHVRNLPQKIGQMKALRTVILHHNAIRVLPPSICELDQLETLDLSYNNISEIPGKMYQMTALKVAHSYRLLSRVGLWLKNNPLKKPPASVWRTTDTENIWSWLRQQEYVKLEKVKQFKVVLIGKSESGKSCLKTALLQHLPICRKVPEQDISAALSVMERDDVRQTKSAPAIRTVRAETPFSRAKTNPDFTLPLSAKANQNADDQSYQRERNKSIKFASEQNLASDETDDLEDLSIIRNAESTESLSSKRLTELMLANMAHDVTRVVSIDARIIVDGIKLCVYDTSGHENYRFLLPLFLHENAFVVVTFDLEAFLADAETDEEAAYKDHVGRWIELCWTYAPRGIVKVVGTHLDTARDSNNVDEAVTWLTERVTNHIESLKMAFEDELQQLAGKRSESTIVSKAVVNALENFAIFRSTSIPNMLHIEGQLLFLVSNTHTMENISELTYDLASTANSSACLKKVQNYVPDNWSQLRRKLKRTEKIVLTFTEVRAFADMYNVKSQMFNEFLDYYTMTGEMIWLKTHPVVSQLIIVRPTQFVGVLQGVYRHDLDTFFDNNQTMLRYQSEVLEPEDFLISKRMTTMYGQISEPILRALWFNIKPNRDEFRRWKAMISSFEIGYVIDWPDSPAARRLMRSALKVPIVTIPPYIKDESSLTVHQMLKIKETQTPLRIVCRAAPFMPEDLLYRMSISLQDVVYERLDWKQAIFCSKDGKDFVVRLETDETDKSENGTSPNTILSFYFTVTTNEYPWIKFWLLPLIERVRLWYPSHLFCLWLDSIMLMIA